MTRDEALLLLLGGIQGVKDWNCQRASGNPIPSLSEAKLSGINLRAANLVRVELDGTDLTGADLSGADLTEANLCETNFSRAKLGGVKLRGARLRGAKLQDAYLSEVDLTGADLSGAHLNDTYLSDADLTDANLSNAHLTETKLTRTNLARAKLVGARLVETNFASANLIGVDFTGAKFSEVNLSGADLRGVELHWAQLVEVDLSRADLSNANLTKADLSGGNLCSAKLVGANLCEAKLAGADLTGVDLSRANLTGADLSEANLSGADLRGANLTLVRLFRTNLARALVEDAIVQDVQPFQLRGLPSPANVLRLGSVDPYTRLTGEEAASFFVMPAVVEVLLTHKLQDAEFGCLHFHQGEVHGNGVAPEVYLVGHRHEGTGSVLRFQGPSYDAVYAALPDLLAAFRNAKAVNWKMTLDAVPKNERDEVITALVKAETRLKTGRWQLASRLADAFEGFADARVVKLVEGRKKGVSITVFSDATMLEKLARAALPSGATSAALVFQGPSTHYHGDTFNIAGHVIGSAIGRDANVSIGQLDTKIHSPSASSQDPKSDQLGEQA